MQRALGAAACAVRATRVVHAPPPFTTPLPFSKPLRLQHQHHQQQQQQRMTFSSQSRAFASAAHEGRNLKQRMCAAAAAAAAAAAVATTFLLMSRSSAPTHCSSDAPPAHVTCASDVPMTAEQLLSRVSRRRNVRASGGKQGFVCWVQKDFGGRCALHPCICSGVAC